MSTNNDEADSMIDQAYDYMRLAIEHLMPEVSINTEPNYTMPEADVITRALRRLADDEPHPAMVFSYKDTLIIHFLFPNLTDEERETISGIQGCNRMIKDGELLKSNPERHEHYARELGELRKKAEQFENKLTAVQMAILEHPLF